MAEINSFTPVEPQEDADVLSDASEFGEWNGVIE